MLLIIIASIVSALTLIMAYISYKYPFKKENGQKTIAARLFGTFIILSIIGLGYVVYASIKIEQNKIPEQAKAKKHLDSVINSASAKLNHNLDSALQAHNMAYNPTTKTITIIDSSQRKPIDPVMDIIVDSVKFIGSLSKPFVSILFNTINNGIAYNPRCEFLIFTIFDGKLFGHGPKIKADNSLIKSYGIHGYKYASEVALSNNPKGTDTSYIFFKALYSNRQINGKDQPPLRGLFYITIDTVPKTLSEIKIYQVSATDKRHQLQKLLTQNKYW